MISLYVYLFTSEKQGRQVTEACLCQGNQIFLNSEGFFTCNCEFRFHISAFFHNGHKGLFLDIEIYASSESWIHNLCPLIHASSESWINELAIDVGFRI